MKVKIFVNEDPAELEREINEFTENEDVAAIGSVQYIPGSVLIEYYLVEDYHE